MSEQEFKTIVDEDDLVIVTKKRPPLRVEIDTDKLGVDDVLFLIDLRSPTDGEPVSEREILQAFIPVINRCLVNTTVAELPVRALQSVFQTVVGSLENMGTKAKNSSGTSPQPSGQPETAEK